MSALPFDDATSFSPPPAFGPYRVLHQIGSGVLGPVFRTYDSDHDRLVAVKAFRLDVVPEQVARLAEALRRVASAHVAHPAMVAPIEAGLEGTTAFLAMEYVAAETLDVALRHLAPAPLAVAVPILRQMAEAIDAAWQHGPAHGHGALHPRDVFLAPGTNEVRITGFGVVPALESIGVRAPARRPYTAPERAGSDAWDVRADVFALGALAHELLTGRRPAGPGEQDGALPAGITPEVRVRIRRVLSAALAEKPEQRFASAGAFVDALDGVASAPELVELPVLAVPPAEPVLDAVPEAAPEGAAPDKTPAIETPPQAVPPAPVEETPAVAAAVVDVGAEAGPVESADLHPELPPVFEEAPAARASLPSTRVEPSVSVPGPFAQYTPVSGPPAPYPWAALVVVFIAGAVVGGVGVATMTSRRAQPSPPVVAAAPPQAAPAAPRGDAVPPGTDVQVTPPPATAPAPPAPKATTGRLVVTSTPAGASVLVDGQSRGRTPITIRGLPFATHTVVVARPGYKSETRRVPLAPDRLSGDVTVELTRLRASPTSAPTARAGAPAAETGSIDVDSRPRGATVFIDGRRLGVTPMRVPDVRAGSHAIRLELAGHKPVSSTLVVAPGDPTRFTVTLEQMGGR